MKNSKLNYKGHWILKHKLKKTQTSMKLTNTLYCFI